LWLAGRVRPAEAVSEAEPTDADDASGPTEMSESTLDLPAEGVVAEPL
jgi:hypothetical protein